MEDVNKRRVEVVGGVMDGSAKAGSLCCEGQVEKP